MTLRSAFPRKSQDDSSLDVPPSGNIQDDMDETTPLIIRPHTDSRKSKEPRLSLVLSLMKQWLPLLAVVCYLTSNTPVVVVMSLVMCFALQGWLCRMIYVLLEFLYPLLQK